jgi:hypothetical protein
MRSENVEGEKKLDRRKMNPKKTHWDKGTQTEDVILEQDLPPKKRHIQMEEESP